MPIYEYRCEDCGRISEFLVIRTDDKAAPQCKQCKSKKMSRVLSRVRVVRSEESRIESLADPSKWGDLDEKDPKSMAKMMKRMGKEFGDEMGDLNMDEMEQAIEEEMGAPRNQKEDQSVSRGIKDSMDLPTKRRRAKIREEIVRSLAGWLSHEEAEELREAIEIFEEIHEEKPSLFAVKGENNSH